MCGFGCVVGIVLGALFVGVLEFLDDRLHSDNEIKKLLPAAIVSEVLEILTIDDKHRNARRVVFGRAISAGDRVHSGRLCLQLSA
jgi:polysaccharide biosynthesis transport protein